jgi:deoxyribonuclease V
MDVPRAPHRWSVTPRQARAIQRRLAARVRPVPLRGVPRLVAGLDAAFSRDDRLCLAAVVVWDMREQRVVEQRVAARRLTFPYVPGLLSFREAPAVLTALRKLCTPPDVLVYDGHGLAHPRRFGIACHIGVILDLPTVGCAKSRLIGTHREPGSSRGAVAPLIDDGEVIGSVLRTQDGINPVFVSVGHLIDLRGAQQIVLACAVRYRLPEPTRLADQLVGAAKRAMGEPQR